jgi:hypothetical protein
MGLNKTFCVSFDTITHLWCIFYFGLLSFNLSLVKKFDSIALKFDKKIMQSQRNRFGNQLKKN